MNRRFTTLLIALLVLAGAVATGAAAKRKPPGGKHVTDVYAFHVKTIDGVDRSLADFKGKTLLIVNTASECGNTPQYEGLETLYEKYRARGFEVLAFPANDFGKQEPGTNAEIKTFCSTKYRTTFPLFAKISVKGDRMAPLYRYLTHDSGFAGDIDWNFAKFLIGPDGKVAARYESEIEPLAPEITGRIESLLATRGH
jgi:glutathione peroxidase